MIGDSNIVEREVRIAARSGKVFAFLVEPEKMLRWMGVEALLEPQPGGIYRVVINEHDIVSGRFVIVSGRFVEVTPNKRVAFTWGWEGAGAPVRTGASTVEITLSEDGDGTILRLRHLDLPDHERDHQGAGWDHYLPRLLAIAEGRDPGPDPLATIMA